MKIEISLDQSSNWGEKQLKNMCNFPLTTEQGWEGLTLAKTLYKRFL